MQNQPQFWRQSVSMQTYLICLHTFILQNSAKYERVVLGYTQLRCKQGVSGVLLTWNFIAGTQCYPDTELELVCHQGLHELTSCKSLETLATDALEVQKELEFVLAKNMELQRLLDDSVYTAMANRGLIDSFFSNKEAKLQNASDHIKLQDFDEVFLLDYKYNFTRTRSSGFQFFHWFAYSTVLNHGRVLRRLSASQKRNIPGTVPAYSIRENWVADFFESLQQISSGRTSPKLDFLE